MEQHAYFQMQTTTPITTQAHHRTLTAGTLTGHRTDVSNAHIVFMWAAMGFVCRCQISARLGVLAMETALHAIKVTS